MIVKLTASAESDLRQIGDWIANDNPMRAISFVEELSLACRKLAEAPLASPVLASHPESGVRRRPYRNYLIFYRLQDDVIEILHVVHGARDYDAILFPKD
jgi:plasmid stabilization system protein ParE